jgi:hypothetical protein
VSSDNEYTHSRSIWLSQASSSSPTQRHNRPQVLRSDDQPYETLEPYSIPDNESVALTWSPASMEPVRVPVTSRTLYDSAAPASNGISISPASNTSTDIAGRYYATDSPARNGSSHGTNSTHTSNSEHINEIPVLEDEQHVIHLSSIEHCMPRAYIRVCLAYRTPDDADLDDLIVKLNGFARKLVDSKPYLAGYVVPAVSSKSQVGLAEIHFTDRDFLNFPQVHLQHISSEDIPYDYDQLNERALPPSLIRPDVVSALPEGTNDEYAPVFRLQANAVKGGLIVSAYLHHCISDGTGMGYIITGSVLKDDFTFDRHLESRGFVTHPLHRRLEEFANQQSIVRQKLNWSSPNQISNRTLLHGSPYESHGQDTIQRSRPNGRGVVFAFDDDKLLNLRTRVEAVLAEGQFVSANDILRE